LSTGVKNLDGIDGIDILPNLKCYLEIPTDDPKAASLAPVDT
tara:strand:- start:477 stop:602 length:126 start_codon:yes stop_codon:yes gene_type:complete